MRDQASVQIEFELREIQLKSIDPIVPKRRDCAIGFGVEALEIDLPCVDIESLD